VSSTIDLADRVALVTGAGSGIGRECAERLADCGAAVVVSDSSVESARKVAQVIGSSGGTARPLELDVADWGACLAAADSFAGGVEILVTSAATWQVGPFLDMEPSTWQRDLAVTLGGCLNVTRAFLPAMIALGRGSIVTISSDAGRIGQAGQVVYSAAKAGVIGMTKSLACEVGRYGIRVNSVAPSLTRTPGAAAFLEGVELSEVVKRYPLGRIGEPADIAGAVVFLASDLAAWITGQVLSVNGGFSMAG
jgi:2-hydroxycyclohexanecarboxyl-CoA dehydrogenase